MPFIIHKLDVVTSLEVALAIEDHELCEYLAKCSCQGECMEVCEGGLAMDT